MEGTRSSITMGLSKAELVDDKKLRNNRTEELHGKNILPCMKSS